jgi:hypothetical protein
MFYEASSFDQVRRYVKDHIDLFSCFTYDQDKFSDMQSDFNAGGVTYLLLDDAIHHGYVRLLDPDYIDHEGDQRTGLVDIIIPRNLGDYLEDLKEYAFDHGWSKLYLNAEIPWISSISDEYQQESLDINVPNKNVLRHFEQGSGVYNSLIDILK